MLLQVYAIVFVKENYTKQLTSNGMGSSEIGIITTSVALRMGKISRGEAEWNFHFQCNKSGIYPAFPMLFPDTILDVYAQFVAMY